jgi:two-component system, NarL family, sensor kinase
MTEFNVALWVVVVTISFLILSAFVILVVIKVSKERIKSQKLLQLSIYRTLERERVRVTEELHDNIGVRLSALRHFINAPGKCINIEDKESNQINEIVDTTIQELRKLIRNESSTYLINNGFIHELNRFVNLIKESGVIEFEIGDISDSIYLNNEFGFNVFRILQELINNSVKHSECNKIRITIITESDSLLVIYSDNGKGFLNKQQSAGIGTGNIDARVKMFKGTYMITDSENYSTKYIMRFPDFEQFSDSIDKP